MNNKYVFPDYDPDAQLIAVSTIIRSLTNVLEEKEKSFDETDYSKLNPDYAGEFYAEDICNLGFLETAVSHSAVAVIAPFLEGLFCHEIAALHSNGFQGKTQHPRSKEKGFWNSKLVFNNNSGEMEPCGIVKGVHQILEALELLKFFPDNFKEMLEIIFSYRNHVLHNGFEFKIEQRNKFKREIEEKGWGEYFSWCTSDGKPWIASMKRNFMLKCFEFCIKVKEATEQMKGIS